VPAALLFLHENWWTSSRYFSNGPYWSIAYEFWFYAAFGAWWFLAGRRRWVALAAIALVAGPKIALLFPVWLLGVAVWHVCRRYTPSPAVAAALLAAAVGGYIFYVVTGAYQILEDAGFGLTKAAGVPPGDLKWSEPWLSYYVLGGIVAAGFLGLHGLSGPLERVLAPAEGAIRWVAGATFTMYLMHYPLMHAIASVLPGDPEDPYRAIAIFLLTLIGIFSIASVTERRRDLFGRAYDHLVALVWSAAWLTRRRAAQQPISKR
jgi:peptidoglycan/LPS O-acetylase OafA/YrhL